VVLRARLAPELLDVLVGELRSLPLDDLLAVLPVALRRFGQVGQVSTVIHQALGRLSLQQAATVLCTFCGSKAIPTTPLTSELLDTVAGNVLDELPEGVISAQAMLAGSGSPAARQALALLDRVHMGGAAAVGQHELDRIDNDDLRAGVTVAVRRSALSRFNTVNDLNSIWFAPSLAAYATTGERLRTLFGDLNLVRLNSSRCHTLLEWIVCDVIQQDPDFLGGRLTPALRDLACQETCIRLAGRIPLERWMFDPPRIEHLDRRSRAWWNSFKPSTPKASR
jgi:hypothetical protein